MRDGSCISVMLSIHMMAKVVLVPLLAAAIRSLYELMIGRVELLNQRIMPGLRLYHSFLQLSCPFGQAADLTLMNLVLNVLLLDYPLQ